MKAQLDAQQKTAEIELAAQTQKDLVAHRQAELDANTQVKMYEIRKRYEAALGQQEATVEAAEISAEARRKPNGSAEEAS